MWNIKNSLDAALSQKIFDNHTKVLQANIEVWRLKNDLKDAKALLDAHRKEGNKLRRKMRALEKKTYNQ